VGFLYAICLKIEGFATMKRLAWLSFWILGITWGSSFLFIKLSVAELPTLQVVFIRVFVAGVGLMLYNLVRGIRMPFTRESIVPLLILGITNNAIPFVLITWGEHHIDSSVASILQSSASLFTLVIAHFFFEDERMTPQRIAGMVVGFIGVMVLFGINFNQGSFSWLVFLGQLSVVGASLFYASSITFSRKVLSRTGSAKIPSTMVAGVSMLSASLVIGIAMVLSPVFGGDAPLWFSQVSAQTTRSVLILAFYNTLFAYGIFYFIVASLGAARASMVTYVVPIVGLVLGVVFNNEPLTRNLIFGSLLIVSGIGIVNLPKRPTTPA